MVVRTANGEVTKFKTANIEEVTFEMDVDLPDVPTTIEEAKAMLVGYWVWIAKIYDDDNVEGYFFVVTEDFRFLLGGKVKDSVTDGSMAPYAGKYVAFELGEVTFPNEEDPTTFYLGYAYYSCTNLQIDSFELISSDANYPCVRVEPFEYIFLEDGLMKNGLMKK